MRLTSPRHDAGPIEQEAAKRNVWIDCGMKAVEARKQALGGKAGRVGKEVGWSCKAGHISGLKGP